MGLPNTYNKNFTNDVVNTLKNTYHINIYINGNLLTDITTQNFFNSSGYDRIEYRLDSGYIFDGDVYSRYIYDGVRHYPLMTKTSDSVAYFDLPIYDTVPYGNYSNYLACYYGNFALNGITKPYFTIADSSANVFTLTKTLSNCVINPNISTMTENENISFSINANAGYQFDSVPTLLDSQNVSIPLTKVSDTQYSASFIAHDNLTLTASAIAEPSSVSLEKNLTNCSLSPDVNSFIEGQTYNIVLTADAGYIFDVAPSFRYKNREGTSMTIPLTKVSDYVYKYDGLTIDANKAKRFFITAYANIESVTSNKYGVLQIHKIDADTLKAFNDLRYYSGSGSLSQTDLSQYISALKVIFADATSTANDNILVSNINTGISAPKIDDDYITLDLGNVLLAGMYHNALDKKYSEILLNLPFVDVYKLDSDYMNETINIKYRINLISGDGAIFISIVRDSETFLIDVINVNMSFDLPYVYPIESNIKQLNTKIKAVNFNVSPTVTIKQRLKADANNSVYQCYKIDTPANENGYFKIERLDADTIPASASIRNKIENLLKAGVYI